MKNNNNNTLLLKYASLGTQLFLALGISIFVGLKVDKMLNLATPILVWVLPLIIIIVLLYKVIKDTAKLK